MRSVPRERIFVSSIRHNEDRCWGLRHFREFLWQKLGDNYPEFPLVTVLTPTIFSGHWDADQKFAQGTINDYYAERRSCTRRLLTNVCVKRFTYYGQVEYRLLIEKDKNDESEDDDDAESAENEASDEEQPADEDVDENLDENNKQSSNQEAENADENVDEKDIKSANEQEAESGSENTGSVNEQESEKAKK